MVRCSGQTTNFFVQGLNNVQSPMALLTSNPREGTLQPNHRPSRGQPGKLLIPHTRTDTFFFRIVATINLLIILPLLGGICQGIVFTGIGRPLPLLLPFHHPHLECRHPSQCVFRWCLQALCWGLGELGPASAPPPPSPPRPSTTPFVFLIQPASSTLVDFCTNCWDSHNVLKKKKTKSCDSRE